MDDLAEARQKGTWVKQGFVPKEESDIPVKFSAAARSTKAVKEETGHGHPGLDHALPLVLCLRRLIELREPPVRRPKVAEFRFQTLT